MTSRALSICLACSIYDGDTNTCPAFPDGVPDNITLNMFDHRNPYPGDHGILFTLQEGRQPILESYQEAYDEAHDEAEPSLLKMAMWDPAKHPRGQPQNAGEFASEQGAPPISERVSAPYRTAVGAVREREAQSGVEPPKMVSTDLIPSDDTRGDGTGRNASSLDKVLIRQAAVPGFGNINLSDPKNALEDVIRRQTLNLSDLADLSMQLSPKGTKAHAMWYPRAHDLLSGWADELGFDHHAAFAATAVLSPGADWADNLAWSRRIMEMVSKQDSVKTEQPGIDAIEAVKQAAYENSIKNAKDPSRIKKPVATTMKAGTLLKDLSDEDLGAYIRGNAEANGKLMQMGGAPGFGDSKTIARPSTWAFLANAVSVLRDPSLANIDTKLGKELKVRSFYNNINEPFDDTYQDVTTDTHHFGAANGLPLGISHPFIASGTASLTSSPKVAATGVAGTYPIIVEATRRAAKVFNDKYEKAMGMRITPNQLQSIVWEMHRTQYPSTIRKKDFIDFIGHQRSLVADGTITRQQANDIVEAERSRLAAVRNVRFKTPKAVERAKRNGAWVPSRAEIAAQFDQDAKDLGVK